MILVLLHTVEVDGSHLGLVQDVPDVPDTSTVSSSLQQMWALTEVMQTQQTSASVGRFDVSLWDVRLLPGSV